VGRRLGVEASGRLWPFYGRGVRGGRRGGFHRKRWRLVHEDRGITDCQRHLWEDGDTRGCVGLVRTCGRGIRSRRRGIGPHAKETGEKRRKGTIEKGDHFFSRVRSWVRCRGNGGNNFRGIEHRKEERCISSGIEISANGEEWPGERDRQSSQRTGGGGPTFSVRSLPRKEGRGGEKGGDVKNRPKEVSKDNRAGCYLGSRKGRRLFQVRRGRIRELLQEGGDKRIRSWSEQFGQLTYDGADIKRL